jgi:hypothetical protein
MKIELIVPNSLNEITLGQYQKYLKLGELTETEFPLKTVYQFSKRVSLYKGGVKMKNSGMIAYAWYVWDKDYVGKPTIEWIR